MRRTFSIEAQSDENDIHARVTLNTVGLTRDEAEHLRATVADRVMNALTNLPYFMPHLSEMKVRR